MKMNGIIRTLFVGGVCVASVACSGNQKAEQAAAEAAAAEAAAAANANG